MKLACREEQELQPRLYLAGERVPPGKYRQLETRQVVILDVEDVLPASLDGHVALYERLDFTWQAWMQAHPQLRGLSLNRKGS